MKYYIVFLLIPFSVLSNAQSDEEKFELINKSDNKAELIFDNKLPGGIMFRADLFRNWQIYKEENAIILHFPIKKRLANRIYIFSDSVIVKKKENVLKRYTDTLKTIGYRTNVMYFENDSGYMDAKEIFDTTEYIFNNVKAEVIQQGTRCNDTGNNSVKLIYKSGTVLFNNMNNIKIFETDINKDGKNEIYIINFSCCDGKLKIYKIE
ncbi:MAG: hypothetical protein L3J35_00795 [Bacteroidales bacterium]|nr:hypothetical protein [Bacteroidales bacterium]